MKRRIKILSLVGLIISSETIGLFFLAVIQTASPSARYGSAMVYDPILQKTIIFGGIRGTDNNLGDTWILNHGGNSWNIVKGSDP